MSNWWHSENYDPMADLEACKHNMGLMMPALEEHAQVIRKILKQQEQMLLQHKRNLKHMENMAYEIKMLRLLLESQEKNTANSQNE